MPLKNNEIINHLSNHLFWDVDKSFLDIEEDRAFIIKRVLEYGLLNDWVIIKEFYTFQIIVNEAKEFRELEPRACSYLSLISQTPITEFRCYSTNQSTPPHWNF